MNQNIIFSDLITDRNSVITSHFDNILQNASSDIYLYAKNSLGQYLETNQAFLMMNEMNSLTEIVGKTDFDLWQKTAVLLKKNDDEVFSTGHAKIVIESITTKNKTQQFLSYKIPLRSRLGKIIGVFGQSTLFTHIQSPCPRIIADTQFLPSSCVRRPCSKFYQTQTLEPLSKRQIECIYYLIKGKTMKQIAKILSLSPRTIEFYISGVRKKLNCNSRAELIEQMLQRADIRLMLSR